jgi:hypothetical protein
VKLSEMIPLREHPRPHAADFTKATLAAVGPDLAPSDFRLFVPMEVY